MAEKNEKLDYALSYAALGWQVMPIHWITAAGVCSCKLGICKRPGKHPLSTNGLKDACTDPATITTWFQRWPDANIGIRTGAVSGVFVLDVDRKYNGLITLDDLEEKHGTLKGLCARTGGGGFHYVFRYSGPECRTLTNLYPGIDARGDGGYIVVEPSNHASGGRYHWIDDDPLDGAEWADIPDWLLAKLKEKNRSAAVKKQQPDKALLPTEIKKIRAALATIPADDRDTWRTVLMALHSTGAGEQAFSLGCEWSRQSDKFDLKDQRRVWDSFKPDGGINLGKLFEIAKQHGYATEQSRPPAPPLSVYESDLSNRVRHPPTHHKIPSGLNPPPQKNPAVLKKAKPVFPFMSAPQLTANPIKIEWIIEDFIEGCSTNLLYGEPGAGKSLVALDWAFCVAAGLDWHGQRTKPTGVFYVAGEGYSGIVRRLKALESKYQTQAPERLFISKQSAQLLDSQNTSWVAESIKSVYPTPGFILIDTLHRNMDGDENSSQDIGRLINNIDHFMKPLGAAVLIVHHSGHGDKQRSRGSSSIRAAMDGEFSTTRTEGGIVLSCQKAKDFEALKPLHFTLKPTVLDGWFDDDGEPMTSVYLEHSCSAFPTIKPHRLSPQDNAILTSLDEAIAAHGMEPTADIKNKYAGFNSPLDETQKVVHFDHWRMQAYKAIVVDGNCDSAKRQAFGRCRKKLLALGLTYEYDNCAWPNFDK